MIRSIDELPPTGNFVSYQVATLLELNRIECWDVGVFFVVSMMDTDIAPEDLVNLVHMDVEVIADSLKRLVRVGLLDIEDTDHPNRKTYTERP